MYDEEEDIPVGGPASKKSKGMDKIQINFLQSHIAQKKSALQSRSKTLPRASAPPPVIDLSARNKAAGMAPVATSKFMPIRANPVAENISFLPKAATDESFMMFGEILIKNEYQVACPNDFEKLIKAKQERVAKEKAAKEIAKRIAREHKDEEKKRTRGAAIAPPQILIEDKPSPSKSPVRQEEEEARDLMPPPSFLPAFGKATSRGLGIAANIMKKHGYREGQGLGKMEQGMSTALQIEKTGIRGGNIVGEAPKPPTPTFATNSLEAMQSATKILVLANLISLEELKADYTKKEEFGDEIREELTKCGQVNKVVVHVDQSEEEEGRQVRVFVEFSNNAQAIKAFVVMNGRYFGGRSVLAGFYNVDDFNRAQF